MTDDAPSNGMDPAPAVDNPDVPPPGAIVNDPADPADATHRVDPADRTDLADRTGPAGPGDPVDPRDPADPIDPEFPRKLSRSGTTGAVVALGSGLLGAAVVVSALRSRATKHGDLDWSNFGIGVGATAVLLVVAVLAALAARRVAGGRAREEAVTWPGVVGILATGLMTAVGIDKDDSWVGYLIGGVIVALSLIGYLAARRPAFVVTGIFGLCIVYLLLFDDLVADSIGEDHRPVVAAALVTVFVLAVTVLGWLLPSRVVTGVAVGVAGAVGLVGVMASMLVLRLLSGFFGGMSLFGSERKGAAMGLGLESSGYSEADVWWVLAFAAVLTVLWALAAAVSNSSGFSLLAIVLPTVIVPMATVALSVKHPSAWGAVLAAAGGVLLLGGVLLSRRRSRRLSGHAA